MPGGLTITRPAKSHRARYGQKNWECVASNWTSHGALYLGGYMFSGQPRARKPLESRTRKNGLAKLGKVVRSNRRTVPTAYAETRPRTTYGPACSPVLRAGKRIELTIAATALRSAAGARVP